MLDPVKALKNPTCRALIQAYTANPRNVGTWGFGEIVLGFPFPLP